MILVTGANGFLGHFVLHELVNQKYKVAALTRQNITSINHPFINWINSDIRDRDLYNKMPEPISAIIHLASSLSLDESTVMDNDIAGMENLLKLWQQGPFVFISSTNVYGEIQKIPITEEHITEPLEWYGYGKLLCEKILEDEARKSPKGPYVIFRPPFIIGLHDLFKQSIIGKIIKRAIENKTIQVPSPKNSGHSWVDAQFAAQSIVQALNTKESCVCNMTNGFITWKLLAEKIIALTESISSIHKTSNINAEIPLCLEERNFSGKQFEKHFDKISFTSLDETLEAIIINLYKCS